jgi:hypothetical protein
MKEFTEKDSLPSAPTLLRSADFNEIEMIIQCLCQDKMSREIFVLRWNEVMKCYEEWEKSFSGLYTSTTNRKLYLYELLREKFIEVNIKNNELLTNVILSSFPKPEQKIVTKHGEMIVQRREISERLGVILTMKSDNGNIISKEIFD